MMDVEKCFSRRKIGFGFETSLKNEGSLGMENWTNFEVLRILQGEMTEDDVGSGKQAVLP